MVRCFLCGKGNINGSKKFQLIDICQVPSSQKPIRLVLTHLANCIKVKLSFESGKDSVCQPCFEKLSEYDSIMVNLLSAQKQLTQQLQDAVNNSTKCDSADETCDSASELKKDDALENLDDENEFLDMDSDEEFVDNDDDDDDFEPTPSKRSKQECVICGSTFKSKYQLQHHISEVHKAQQPFVCKICGITRRDEEYLELHMNIHDGKTENECRYCPKRFSRPVNTLRHMRIHWDKKEYQCEKCGVRFSQDNLLYTHKLKHEAEENPLICSICNLSFKSRKTFNHHSLIHQENRPRHYCTMCPKSFTERYTLKMHMKTHTDLDGNDMIESGDRSQSSISNEGTMEEQVVEILQVPDDEIDQAVTVIVEDVEFGGSCVICNKKFDNKEMLERHLQIDHDVILK